MIKDTIRKQYDYKPKQDLEDAEFVVTNFLPYLAVTTPHASHLGPYCNCSFVQHARDYITTEYPAEQEEIVVAALCEILQNPDQPNTYWDLEAIQPLPGMLKIRLLHRGAFVVEDFESESEFQEIKSRGTWQEAKKIFRLFGGYTADLACRVSQQSPEHYFSLITSVERDIIVSFDVFSDRTEVEFDIHPETPGQYLASVQYALRWKNRKHRKIRAKITTNFYL